VSRLGSGCSACALWIAVLGLGGCGDDADPGADAGSSAQADAGHAPPDESLAEPTTPEGLRAAYQHSIQANALSHASSPCPEPDATGVECASVTVPVSWQQPILGLIALLQRRLPAEAAPRRQLWLLGDGPGRPSAELLAHARAMADAWPGTELLWFDYRGVGASDRLSCPNEEGAGGRLEGLEPPSSESAGRIDRCFRESRVRWSNDIFLFSLTETAADLAALIEAARVAEQPVYVYGLGWGARVAHEYLQLFPEGVDALVLDSFAPPDSVPDRDAATGAAFDALLTACAAETECSTRLGADPDAYARAVLAGLDQGGCAELAAIGLDGFGFRRLLGELAARPALWGLAPVALYRAERCDAAAVQALRMLRDSLRAPQSEPRLQPSDQLALLQLAALGGEPAAAAEVEARTRELLALDGRALLVAAHADVIPARPANALLGRWARTSVPLLVLQGGLDAALTPAAGEAAAEQLGAAYVPVSGAGAGFGLSSACGRTLVSGWLDAPALAPDETCSAQVEIELAVDEATALERLGAANAWGD
jgi:pimeloyl-ACP methyl ester carboxylesterase